MFFEKFGVKFKNLASHRSAASWCCAFSSMIEMINCLHFWKYNDHLTHFTRFLKEGLVFEKKKRRKRGQNHHSTTLFDRRYASGDILGECFVEGLPMGHFQKFKVLWKLDR